MRCERPRDATAGLSAAEHEMFQAFRARETSVAWLQAQLEVLPHQLDGLIEVRWKPPSRPSADNTEAAVLITLHELLPEQSALVRLGTRAARDAGLLGAQPRLPLLTALRSLLQMFASAHPDNIVLVAAPPRSLSTLIYQALGDGSPPRARARGHSLRSIDGRTGVAKPTAAARRVMDAAAAAAAPGGGTLGGRGSGRGGAGRGSGRGGAVDSGGPSGVLPRILQRAAAFFPATHGDHEGWPCAQGEQA